MKSSSVKFNLNLVPASCTICFGDTLTRSMQTVWKLFNAPNINSGRRMKQSHRIILVRSWIIMAFQDIKMSRFHNRFLIFQLNLPCDFTNSGAIMGPTNPTILGSSPGSLTFPIGYTPGQLVLTGAQPPTNCDPLLVIS